MYLHSYVSVKSFVEGCKMSETPQVLTLRVPNLMYAVPEEETGYGLSLLRKSISRYEEVAHIPLGNSKREIPFFRNKRKMLIGPEMEMYSWSFYESAEIPHNLKAEAEPLLRLSFDYKALGEYCLSENMYLLRCKYDEEKNLQTFAAQMEQEYLKFFYDEEHTGFTADSRLFSMLCNACLEVREPCFSSEQEWRMVRFCHPADASYEYCHGSLLPQVSSLIPFSCINRVSLLNPEDNEDTYSALAGFLQHVGLAPERYLDGLIEE
jgi:hypothetical protein